MLLFTGVAGAVVAILIITTATIVGCYYKFKIASTHFAPDMHIYDEPDCSWLGPSLSPKLMKVETADQQLDEKKISANSIKGNDSNSENNCNLNSNLDCEHTQSIPDLIPQLSDRVEENSFLIITMQSNNAYGTHQLNSIETLKDSPSGLPMLDVHLPEQRGISEQIQGSERIEHRIKQVEISDSRNDNVCQSTVCACNMQCQGHNFQNAGISTVCGKQCQETPVEMQSNNAYGTFSPLENLPSMMPLPSEFPMLTVRSCVLNSGIYEQIQCSYEEIEYCDINPAYSACKKSLIAENPMNTAPSTQSQNDLPDCKCDQEYDAENVPKNY